MDSLHLGYTLVSKSLCFIVLHPFPPFRVRRFRLPRDLEDEQQRLLRSFQKSCGDAWNGNPGRPQCIYWPIPLSQSSRKHSPHLTSFLCPKGCTRSWRSQQSPSPPVQQSVPPGWGYHGVAIIYHRSIRFHAAFYLLLNAVGLKSVPILACQHHPKISSNNIKYHPLETWAATGHHDVQPISPLLLCVAIWNVSNPQFVWSTATWNRQSKRVTSHDPKKNWEKSGKLCSSKSSTTNHQGSSAWWSPVLDGSHIPPENSHSLELCCDDILWAVAYPPV